MSAWQRREASKLADKFARVFGVPREQVRIELRDDDDAEVSAPGVEHVWTLRGVPFPRLPT